jgi:hypothetical protein
MSSSCEASGCQSSSGVRRRDAQRRRAIKRQLRKLGVEIPEPIMYNISALRSLRGRMLAREAA